MKNPKYLETQAEPEINITRATLEDLDGILHVQTKTWIATYPTPEADITKEDIESMDLNGPKQRERISRHIETQGDQTHMWVAHEDGKVIGFSRAEKGQDANELRAIYLLPHHHGKGIGKKLMEKAMQWLGTEKNIIVWVAVSNARAIAFYEKFGFKDLGQRDILPLETKRGVKNLPIMKLEKQP